MQIYTLYNPVEIVQPMKMQQAIKLFGRANQLCFMESTTTTAPSLTFYPITLAFLFVMFIATIVKTQESESEPFNNASTSSEPYTCPARKN